MKILGILNPKGGSGKTTVATNLTVGLLRHGHEVLLVDTDRQGSAQDWHAARELREPVQEPLVTCVSMPIARALGAVRRAGAHSDYVVIDGAAKLEDQLQAAIVQSDYVLIPVQPSPYDVWAAGEVAELVKQRQTFTGGGPKAAFLVTRAIANTRLSAEVRGLLDGYELPVFATQVVQRQIYPRSANEGLAVLDMPPSAARTQAASEMEQLTEETLEMMK